MDAENITDALGVGAITISYLKDNGCPDQANWFANKYRFPTNKMDDEALREIVIQWLWSSGLQSAATKIARKFHLEHVVSNVHQDAANSIPDSMGVRAIVISYLKANGFRSEATNFARSNGFPSNRMDNEALREIILRWLWTMGMEAVAGAFATRFHLEQVIMEILLEEGGGGGGGGGGGEDED